MGLFRNIFQGRKQSGGSTASAKSEPILTATDYVRAFEEGKRPSSYVGRIDRFGRSHKSIGEVENELDMFANKKFGI